MHRAQLQPQAAAHSVAQLEAIFGWQGGAMASLYGREADRRRLAIEAMHKLAQNKKGKSIVAPSEKGKCKQWVI